MNYDLLSAATKSKIFVYNTKTRTLISKIMQNNHLGRIALSPNINRLKELNYICYS